MQNNSSTKVMQIDYTKFPKLAKILQYFQSVPDIKESAKIPNVVNRQQINDKILALYELNRDKLLFDEEAIKNRDEIIRLSRILAEFDKRANVS